MSIVDSLKLATNAHSRLCHVGYRALETTLRKIIFWLNLQKDCRGVCNDCLVCLERKAVKKHPYKYESLQAERKFQKVFIALVGLLPKYDGNVCIQKKILLELLKTGTSEEICSVIMKNGLHILENHSSCIQIKALTSIQSKL